MLLTKNIWDFISGKVSLEDKTSTLDKSNLRSNHPDYIVLHSTNLYPEFEDMTSSPP